MEIRNNMNEYVFGKTLNKIIHGGDYNPEKAESVFIADGAKVSGEDVNLTQN